MVNSPTFRCLSAAGLCAAALMLAACGDNGSTSTPSTTGPTATASTGAASDIAKDAQAQVDQIAQYIKSNKIASAERALTVLEQNRAQLPLDIQSKLPELHTALTVAKAAGAGRMPG